MNRTSIWVLTTAAAVALVGCSDTNRLPTAADGGTAAASKSAGAADAASFGLDVAASHILELRTAKGSHGGGGGGGKTPNTGIYYHGGPVLQGGTNVVAVYWAGSPIYSGGPASGSGAGSSDGSLVGYFLSHLGGSPYFNINSTYTDGSGNAIANVVNYTHYWANNANVPANGQKVTDAQMVAMLQAGLDNGSITYDANTVYAIFTGGTVNLGGGFGTQYCAYHTHGSVTVNGTSKTILYAAMPYDYAYPGACTNGTASPNGDAAADAEVNTLAHEVEETTTDMMGNAWYDRRGYENADKCAWQWGSTYTSGGGTANIKVGTKDFLVQMNWVNAGSGGCLKSYP